MVHSRQSVEASTPPDVDHIVVSITMPDDPKEAIVPCNERTLGVLRLQFHDVCTTVAGYNDHLRVFTNADAANILRFVEEHAPARCLIVHCDAGLSRSPAIAAAISKIVTGTDSEIFKRYRGLNMHVYRTIMDEQARIDERNERFDGNSSD